MNRTKHDDIVGRCWSSSSLLMRLLKDQLYMKGNMNGNMNQGVVCITLTVSDSPLVLSGQRWLNTILWHESVGIR
jgi:hypothetical protein